MPPKKKSKATKESTLTPGTNGAGASVPPELLLEIIQEAASPPPEHKGKINYKTRALGAMCRVNKHWQSIAQVSLYKCLSLIDKPGQVAKLRRTVVNSSKIAGSITELDIQVIGELQLPSAPAAITKAVARRQKAGKDVWDILEVLTNLKTLKVSRYQYLTKAYVERLQSTTRLPNLSTVKRFEISWSETWIATILTQSMSSLEEFFSFGVPSHSGDTRLFQGLTAPLTRLSYTGNCGRHNENNWDDWLGIIKCSKDTLHTLELEDMEDIPPETLKSAFEMVAPSLLRLFYGTRLLELQAVFLAALPTFRSLISLRTSLPTTSALDLVSPTIMELGMAHQSRHYQEVQSDETVLRATLKRAKDLPNLKILWLAGKWTFRIDEEEERCLRELKERAVVEGMTWTLLTGRQGMLPLYGSKEEVLYTEALRIIPGVYMTRVQTGTAKIFDPAEFKRLTQK